MEETESIEEEERSMTIEDGLIAGLSRFIMTLIERAIKDVKMWVGQEYEDLECRVDEIETNEYVTTEQMTEGIDAAFEDVSLEDLDGRIDHLETILRDINQVLNDNL